MSDLESLYEHYKFIVPEGQSLLRIDKYLTYKIQNATRHKVQEGIKNNFVLVNDKPVKNNYRLKPNDIITIWLQEEVRDKTHYPENIPLEIIYEDDFLLLVNKPPKMVVHPTFNNYTGTLYNALIYHFQKQGIKEAPFIVHRIDKDTSGLMIIAKDKDTMKHLADQFFHHTIKRTYYAIVWGILEHKKGTIKTFLDRSTQDRKLVKVYKDQGKEAITHYKVLEEYGLFSLVKCNLETGRTHQIRVHLSYIGHPIIKDSFYCDEKTTNTYNSIINSNVFDFIDRQALHSKDILFFHPALNKFMSFETELPKDFSDFLNANVSNTLNSFIDL